MIKHKIVYWQLNISNKNGIPDCPYRRDVIRMHILQVKFGSKCKMAYIFPVVYGYYYAFIVLIADTKLNKGNYSSKILNSQHIIRFTLINAN